MKDWLAELELDPDKPLISTALLTLTRGNFLTYYNRVSKTINSLKDLDRNGFILLRTEDPVVLFTCLLALIDAGYRVALPTPEVFQGQSFSPFASQSVTPQPDGSFLVQKNPKPVVSVPQIGNLICFSSGSTGRPKGIVHDFDNFTANARAVTRIFTETNVSNVTFLKPYLVSAISHFIVHGLTGSHLIFENYSNISSVADLTAKYPGLGIVGSPLQITSAINQMPPNHCPRLFFTSGDVVSQTAINKIQKRFPGVVFYSVYGLAELAGRFFINRFSGDSTSPLGSLGQPLFNTSPIVVDGNLFVESPILFHGYIRESGWTSAAHPHDSGDVVQLKDGAYFFIGRSNDEVKSLGNKINLKYLETKIKNALGSDDLVVVAFPDPRFGNYIGLVLRQWNQDRASLQKALRRHLSPKEMPHKFYVTETFPLTATMKIDRKAIADNSVPLKAL